MKGTQVGTVALSVIFVLLGVTVPNRDEGSFHGEIMDSFCGEAGSHGTIRNDFKNARDCTIGCVRLGAEYVLYSASRNRSYRLDDQCSPALFAGEKVRIIGTYDSNTNTIHVESIQPKLLSSIKRFALAVRENFP